MIEINISDAHWPGEDPLLWKLARTVVRKINPDSLILLGDNVDPSAVSKWTKEQLAKLILQEQIDISVKRLAQLRRDAPRAEIKFYRGNHELWLEKYLIDHAPELRGLRDI